MNVSILIDELEARKNDYILVADVIEAMANATNSKPNDVVKYLNAHDVDEHLTVFYMGENYNFYQYNGFLVNVGNDANTTYFRMSDIVAFEPITKHGIFDDKQTPLVNDVYGRTYDISQYKKNREDDYLTSSEALDFLNHNTDINISSYDYKKLRDLARKKLITPCFYFSGYVGSFTGGHDNSLHTEIITSYFTYRLLTEEVYNSDDYMKLPNDGVKIYRLLEKQTGEYVDYDDGLFLFFEKPSNLDDAEKLKLTHMEADEIRFSKRELESYITSIQPDNDNDDYFIEHVKLVNDDKLKQLDSLKTENDKLNARLNKASDIYRQNQSEIKELKAQLKKVNADNAVLNEQLSNKIDAPADDLTLQTILDESHNEHAPDLKHAINLWIDLYINKGVGGGSHSAMANNWIYGNTGYESSTESSPVKRLREITTPLKDFGGQRPKEVKK